MQIINIDFESHEKDMLSMQKAFNHIGLDALYMNHYELADNSTHSPLEWRVFLTDARVIEHLEQEQVLMQKVSIMKMLKDVDQTKSTATAQLMNTLINNVGQAKTKEGPIFIYTYIPLNKEERNAPNTFTADSDPFENNSRK